MGVIVALLVGAVLGFVAGWLLRDASSRPLTRPGEQIGVGVPDDWYRRQRGD